ncbi:MAG: Txe/YoeB family addiction module toxin [Bacteroidales bacterium]|jgi:toxin YoeB|nr:Txe/YoeB family addiction module toxin [Bacteroidales bacterium]
MEIRFSPTALDDRDFWKTSGQTAIINKITNLLKDIEAHPETGIGKPERLKYQLTGLWSRRINKEHRLVYEICDDHIMVHSMRDHY